MSYGFLTESSLIPKKAVPIKVDASSVLDLQAIVFQKEQAIREAKDSDRKKKRGRAAELKGVKAPERNAGVDQRNAKDLADPRDPRNSEREAYNRLLMKSKLYDKMVKKGRKAVLEDEDEDATRRGVDKEGAYLVDFQEKVFASRKAQLTANLKSSVAAGPRARVESSDDSSSEEEEEPAGTVADVEIVDMFGRQVWVKPGSAEHKEYLAREREQRCLVSSSMREVEEREAWEASCRGDMERGVREDARRVAGEDGPPAHKSSDVKQRFEQRMNDAERAALADVIHDTTAARRDAVARREEAVGVLLGDEGGGAAAELATRKQKSDALLADLLGTVGKSSRFG